MVPVSREGAFVARGTQAVKTHNRPIEADLRKRASLACSAAQWATLGRKAMLYLAALLVLATGIAHSYLGERYILIRLFRRSDLPKLFGGTAFTVGTLRFAWHLTHSRVVRIRLYAGCNRRTWA